MISRRRQMTVSLVIKLSLLVLLINMLRQSYSKFPTCIVYLSQYMLGSRSLGKPLCSPMAWWVSCSHYRWVPSCLILVMNKIHVRPSLKICSFAESLPARPNTPLPEYFFLHMQISDWPIIHNLSIKHFIAPFHLTGWLMSESGNAKFYY